MHFAGRDGNELTSEGIWLNFHFHCSFSLLLHSHHADCGQWRVKSPQFFLCVHFVAGTTIGVMLKQTTRCHPLSSTIDLDRVLVPLRVVFQ